MNIRCGRARDADLILYNTCTVRENANLKVYGHLGQAGGWKKRHPKTIVGPVRLHDAGAGRGGED